MFVVYAIVAILLSLLLLVSAFGKVTKMEQVVENLGKVNVPLTWFPGLAALEVLGAAGLLIGLGVAGIGIAAAIGVICYFVGAITFHVRAGDRNLVPPGVPLVLAIVCLVTRLASI